MTNLLKDHPPHVRHAMRLHDLTRNSRVLVYATILGVFILAAFSPLTRSLPYRSFFAALTQDLVVTRVNPVRTSSGISPLSTNLLLADAARRKAEDMFARQYFAHVGPGGELPWVWFTRAGYSYAAAGENLAIDFSDPDALVSAWLASPTHAQNIRNGVFTDIGVGVANGSFQGRETTIVVMFLGNQAAPPLAAALTPPPVEPPAPSPPPAEAPVAPPPPEVIPTPETPETSVPDPLPQQSLPLPPPIVETRDLAFRSDRIPQTTPTLDRGGLNTEKETIPFSERVAVIVLSIVGAAAKLRLVLTVLLGTILSGSVLLFLLPAHRKHHRFSPAGYLLLLLALLWSPELL